MRTERNLDFIIAGAPKCGTTALYQYLREHPAVFMPDLKEPHFFCSDFPKYRKITEPGDYRTLFQDASTSQLIGEASVWYLYSEVALANITAANPAAKIIVMLRNPVDMAYSLHAQQVHALDEDVVDFQLAWDIQEARDRGQRLPRLTREARFLQYRKVCSFSSQISRLMTSVPQVQRLILILEEFRSDTQKIYQQVLEFLGLPSVGRADFPRVNPNSVRKNLGLAKLATRMPMMLGGAYLPAKQCFNRLGLGPGKRLNQWNTKHVERAPMAGHVRARLDKEFRPDIEELEKLLGRSLPW